MVSFTENPIEMDMLGHWSMESMEDGNLSPDHHGSSEIDLFVMDHISWVIEIVTRFIGHDDPLYIYISIVADLFT